MQLAFSVYSPFGEAEKTLSPIIMLHGITNSRATWNRLAPKLAELTGRKVYTVDLRNHGDSPWSMDFDYDFLTEDVDAFMESQGISKAVIVGHSMGGRIAITLALRKPEKVEKFVAEDMSTGNGTPEMASYFVQYITFLNYATAVIVPGTDELTVRQSLMQIVDQMTPLELRSDTDPESKLLNIAIKATEEGGFTWAANMDVIQRAAQDQRLHQNLEGRYDGEALFIYGEKSFMKVDQEEKDIKTYFPRAKLLVVDGAGHNIHSYREKVFLDTIVNFIDK